MINGGFVFSPLHYKAKRNRSPQGSVVPGRLPIGEGGGFGDCRGISLSPYSLSGSGLDNVAPSRRLERALAGFFLGLLKREVFFRWLRAAAIVQGAWISDEIRPRVPGGFCRNSGAIPAFAIAETKPCRREWNGFENVRFFPSTLPGSIPAARMISMNWRDSPECPEFSGGLALAKLSLRCPQPSLQGAPATWDGLGFQQRISSWRRGS